MGFIPLISQASKSMLTEKLEVTFSLD
jgi:hypothetical protein